MDYSPSLHCPNNLIPATFQCLWTRRYLHCVLSLSHNKSPHRNTIMLKHHISAESSIMWLAVPYEKNSTNLGYQGNQHPWSVSDHLLRSILHHNTSKCETSHTTQPTFLGRTGLYLKCLDLLSDWINQVTSEQWGEGQQLFTYPKHNQHLNQRPNNKPLSSGLSGAPHHTLPQD